MEQNKKKKYDPDFKRSAVQMADSGERTDRQVEKDLGLYQGAVRSWRSERAADPHHAFPGIGRLKPADDVVRRLKRENDILRMECDIVKKAMAIFSRPKKSGTGS
jgi:transposase